MCLEINILEARIWFIGLPQWWQGLRFIKHTHTHPCTRQYYNSRIESNLFNSSDFLGYISGFNQHYDIESYKTFGNQFDTHCNLPLPNTCSTTTRNKTTISSQTTATQHWDSQQDRRCDTWVKITLLALNDSGIMAVDEAGPGQNWEAGWQGGGHSSPSEGPEAPAL